MPIIYSTERMTRLRNFIEFTLQVSQSEVKRMPKNILSDAEGKQIGYTSEKKYSESFRVIRFYDEENDREFTFLTNAKHISALDVANLYKKDGSWNSSSNG